MNLLMHGSAVASSSLNISCRLTLDEVVSNITLVWMTSSGIEMDRTDELTPAIGGSVAILDLSFNSLMLSDAGLYNCTAAVVGFNGETLNVTQQYTLTVAGIEITE